MVTFLKRLRQKIRHRRRQRIMRSYQSLASNIRLELQAAATRATAAYVAQNMRSVQSVTSWRAVHDIALDQISIPDGLVLELGVFRGTSITHIARHKNVAQVHGFDSFQGLPENWRDGYPAGHFSLNAPPEVPENVTLHIGWFDESLPRFCAELAQDAGRDQPIAYLHMDGDLYSSAKCVFDHLQDRIVAGTIIVFDQYFNYDGWEFGEFKAFQEFAASRGVDYEYLTYNHEHQQVALRIL